MCAGVCTRATVTMSDESKSAEDKNIQMFKVRKLIASLERARGLVGRVLQRARILPKLCFPLSGTALA